MEINNNLPKLPRYITSHPKFEFNLTDFLNRKIELFELSKLKSKVVIFSGVDLENTLQTVIQFYENRKKSIINLKFNLEIKNSGNMEFIFQTLKKEIGSFLQKKNLVINFREIPRKIIENGFVELLLILAKHRFKPFFYVFERDWQVANKIKSRLKRKIAIFG